MFNVNILYSIENINAHSYNCIRSDVRLLLYSFSSHSIGLLLLFVIFVIDFVFLLLLFFFSSCIYSSYDFMVIYLHAHVSLVSVSQRAHWWLQQSKKNKIHNKFNRQIECVLLFFLFLLFIVVSLLWFIVVVKIAHVLASTAYTHSPIPPIEWCIFELCSAEGQFANSWLNGAYEMCFMTTKSRIIYQNYFIYF